VRGAAEDALRVEALGPQHDRAGFESGVEPLDRYFHVQAGAGRPQEHGGAIRSGPA